MRDGSVTVKLKGKTRERLAAISEECDRSVEDILALCAESLEQGYLEIDGDYVIPCEDYLDALYPDKYGVMGLETEALMRGYEGPEIKRFVAFCLERLRDGSF